MNAGDGPPAFFILSAASAVLNLSGESVRR